LLGRTLGLPDASYKGVLKWVLDFRESMDIPHDLAAIGIPADRADDIGMMALNDPTAGGNPVALTAGKYSEIFLKAVHGNL